MVMIEMRDAAYDTAFELLEEAKHSAKKTKLTLCELEDAMYDCYESSKEEQESYEPEDSEMEFRGRRGYRHNEDDDAEDMNMRMRSNMRRMNRRSGMRRNRMGRFV